MCHLSPWGFPFLKAHDTMIRMRLGFTCVTISYIFTSGGISCSDWIINGLILHIFCLSLCPSLLAYLDIYCVLFLNIIAHRSGNHSYSKKMLVYIYSINYFLTNPNFLNDIFETNISWIIYQNMPLKVAKENNDNDF